MTEHRACPPLPSDLPPDPPLPPAPAAEGGNAAAAAPAAAPIASAEGESEGESELGIEINGTWYPLSQLTFVVQLTYADGTTAVARADQPSGP